MGMYTDLKLDVKLDKADGIALDILRKMCNSTHSELYTENEKAYMQDFEIFKSFRYAFMLCCGSAYFNEEPDSEVYYKDGQYRLKVICNFKNYNDEVRKFCDWIYTLTSDRGCVGSTRYEESEYPYLIIFGDADVRYRLSDEKG